MSINARIHCLLTQQTTIKGESTRNLRYAQLHTNILQKSLSSLFLSKIFLSYWLKHRRRFGWHHTGVLLFLPVHFASFPLTETTTITASSIRYDEEPNCWFSISSVWRYRWETLIIQAIFPNDKRVPRSTR